MATIFSKPNQQFWLSWIKFNPIEEIKKGKPDAEYVIIKNMNHVLKEVKDQENLKSYFSPDYPLSKKLIQTISTFVKK